MPAPVSVTSITIAVAVVAGRAGATGAGVPPAGMASSALAMSSSNACSTCIGSTRASGRSRGRSASSVTFLLAQQPVDGGQQSRDQRRARFSRIGCNGAGREKLSRWVMRRSSRSTSLIDGARGARGRRASRGGAAPAAPRREGSPADCGGRARQRRPSLRSRRASPVPPAAPGPSRAVRSCRKLGVEAHQVGARVPQAGRHLLEAPGQVADLVAGAWRDRMVQVARADHRHRLAAARRSAARGSAR